MGIQLSPDSFLEEAVKTTGLEDFNGNSFQEGLHALIDSLNHDIEMGEGIAGYFQAIITGLLSSRLQITQFLKDNPEIEKEEIKQPLFIVGLPRTGTTLLQTLVALDPLSRYLRNYELFPPICPPPQLIPAEVDPRVKICHDSMESFFHMAPNLRGINGLNFLAHGTAECQNLTAMEFVHLGWSAGSSLFSHGNWVAECDMQAAYRWHKLLLQLLQWKYPNERWILKAPMHLFGIAQLLQTYPDAKIIFTHRDPLGATASGISMVCQWTKFSTQQLDIEGVVKWYPALWANGLKRALAVREKLPAPQVYDMYLDELSSDPMETVKKIYEHFDLPMSRTMLKRMGIWLNDNPRSRFGQHSFTHEELNIEPERIKELFDFYVKKFF